MSAADFCHAVSSAERLQPRRASDCVDGDEGFSDCDNGAARYAYENRLAIDDEEDQIEQVKSTNVESSAPPEDVSSEPDVTPRQSYELAAAQASCWLRQLICQTLDDPETATDASAADAETETQLRDMFAQFDRLSAVEQGRVPERLNPARLALLHARQRAVVACLAKAASLSRRRREARDAAEQAASERLSTCHQRLQLVSRCAVGLSRRLRCEDQPAGARASTVDQAGDEDLDDGDDMIRDLRLLDDSASRARRNITEALDDLTGDQKAVLLSQRHLTACGACLTARAAGLAAFAERHRRQRRRRRVDAEDVEAPEADDTAASGGGSSLFFDDLMRGVKTRVEEAIERASEVTFEPRRLAREIARLERSEDLVRHASIAADEAAERGDSAEAAAGAQRALSALRSRLASAKRPMAQLLAAVSQVRDLRRQLYRRTQRLRHLVELARGFDCDVPAGGPAAFLADDEEEATSPTTPELLATIGASIAAHLRRCRELATASEKSQVRLASLSRSCNRRLAAAEAARLELATFEKIAADRVETVAETL